jgi:hypothetical protein
MSKPNFAWFSQNKLQNLFRIQPRRLHAGRLQPPRRIVDPLAKFHPPILHQRPKIPVPSLILSISQR